MQLYYTDSHRVPTEILDALLDISQEVDQGLSVVPRGVTKYGIFGRLYYRDYRSGFSIEIEDPQYLFKSKKQFTKEKAKRRLLNHIKSHEEDIRATMEGFVAKVEEKLAEQEPKATQQEE